MPSRRLSVTPYLASLFVLQCLAILLTLLLSDEPTPTEIAVYIVALFGSALLDVWVCARTSRILRTSTAAYETDIALDLERSLEEYRAASNDDRLFSRQIAACIENELVRARRALASGQRDEARQCLSNSLEMTSQVHAPTCENPIVAAVLSSKERQCAATGVTLQAEVSLPASLPISNTELASLFFNLIDNALHECDALLQEEPSRHETTIRVYGFVQAGQLYTEVVNPCRPGAEDKHRFALLNADSTMFHGLGSGIVTEIARSNGGLTECEERDGCFVARVMIPLPEESPRAV